MSSFLHRFPLSLLALAVLVCGVFTPKAALAWAPMCDLTASTVVAPMVAPPVESGEILPCPAALDDDHESGPAVHGVVTDDGRTPQPPSEDAGPRLDPFPVSAVLGELVSPFACASLLLPLGESNGGPRAGFGRSIERPPCS